MSWSRAEPHRLHAAHACAVRRHLLALDQDDRVARFGLGMRDEALGRWCAGIDWGRQRWWGVWLPGKAVLAGVLQLAPTGREGAWELALSVAAPLRRRGIGMQLLAQGCASPARVLHCHHGHPAVRVMAARLGCGWVAGAGLEGLDLIPPRAPLS